MLFYATLLLISSIGMLIIARRNRELFYASNLSKFMEILKEETANLWHAHLRERAFAALEKTLRTVRLWFIRIENRLYKANKFIRGKKERNANGAPENGGNTVIR